MKSGWKKYLLYASLIIVGVGLTFGLLQVILAGYSVNWTGFGEYIPANPAAERGKTVWDWMELLLIPLTLLIGGYILNRSERSVERKIASDRAELEREIAKDRQREQALQAYLDRMSDLLLEKKLRTTEEAEVKDIARTRTLSVLRGLDGRRKGQVIQFLYEAKLLHKTNNIVNLQGADLEHANLQGVNLEDVDLSLAILDFADLMNANLHSANLQNTFLAGAKLGMANLQNANLQDADLRHADLSGAVLFGADLSRADLSGADLFGVSGMSLEQIESAWGVEDTILPSGAKQE